MKGRFPALSLAVSPPLTPMEAQLVEELPKGAGWQYEPKWDGFRCIAFRDGRTVVLQSKAGEPLTRYFPEVVMALSSVPEPRFALDGELVVIGDDGRLRYDELVQRIHPSARRVAQLSATTPATLLAFDLLAIEDESLTDEPLSKRRARLEKLFKQVEGLGLHLSPATSKRAEALGWLRELAGAGLDGLVAKRRDEPYRSGDREAMAKVKTERTADCVVGGVRRNGNGEVVALLLGLYGDEGALHFVGTTASLAPELTPSLAEKVAPLVGGEGFTGRQPAAPGRAGRVREWEPVKPTLVCEVRYDRFTEEGFRHPPSFVRWRPDKAPSQCRFDQVRPPKKAKGHGLELIGL